MHVEGMQIYSIIIQEVTCMYRACFRARHRQAYGLLKRRVTGQILCKIRLTSVNKCILQACTPYDPVEAGRARMEALLRRLQEMGFGFEAAKGALKTATREGLRDQPALERAAELLMSAGAG